MRYSLCESCMHFQPEIKTELRVVPRSCKHPVISELYGPKVGGFLKGVQIISCIHHAQYPINYNDIALVIDGVPTLGYVLTNERDFKHVRVPKLYDNSKNIKLIKYEQIKSSVRLGLEEGGLF